MMDNEATILKSSAESGGRVYPLVMWMLAKIGRAL